MSRKQKIKDMSSEELKSKLYAHFQKSGAFDHLQAQLRGQLVSELFKVAEPIDSDKFPISSDVDKCLLPFQVSNWLVYDHLSRQDYQYSLSTFVTEAHLPYPEKFLTAGDILKLLGLSRNGADYETINKLYSEINELGHLHSLLLAIIKIMFNVPNKASMLDDSHYQTNKMHDSNKKEPGTSRETSTHNFNSAGIGDMSSPDELSKSRQMSSNKSLVNDNVKSADVSFDEQLENVKAESERAVQELRHKLLQELENLYSQESKMRIESEQGKAELRKEQNKLLKEREMLKEKEVLMEKEIKNKLEMKFRDAESDFASKLYFKDKEIESLKLKLSERDEKLNRVESELASEKDNYTVIKRDLEDSQHMYKILQDKYSDVLDEHTNLSKKIKSMSDYTILKEELASKSEEVKKLHNEIKNIHQRSEAERKKYVETVRNLEDNLSVTEPQLMKAKKELNQVKSTLCTEEANWNKERTKLEMELGEFKELYKTVIQRIEDQKEDIQELHKTIHILNYKLTNTVINASKSESLGPYKNFRKSADIYHTNKSETLFTKRNTFMQQPDEHNHLLKFLSDAKSRGNILEQEEDAVREKYSFLSSTIPENNKYDSNFEKYKLVSLPKSYIADYQTLLTKPVSFNSSFSLDSYSKNKNLYSKNHFQRRQNLGISSEVSNVVNSNTLKEHKVQSPYNSNKYLSPQLTENTSAIPENTLNENMILDDSQTIASPVKCLSQNKEPLNPLQDLVKDKTDDKLSNFQQESENAKTTIKNSLADNIHTLSVGGSGDEGAAPIEKLEIISRVHEVAGQNNTAIPEKMKLLLPESSQVQDETLKKSEIKPQQNSTVFVNLDAVWQRRSSVLTLPSITQSTVGDKARNKPQSNSSDSIAPVNSSQQNISDNFQNKDKTDQLKYTTEHSDNDKRKQTMTNTTEIPTEIASLVVESKDTVQKKSKSDGQEHIKTTSVDNFGNTENVKENYSDEEKVKSTEKVGSTDSLSELSEIHLSCGSETEQQKEDSDAW